MNSTRGRKQRSECSSFHLVVILCLAVALLGNSWHYKHLLSPNWLDTQVGSSVFAAPAGGGDGEPSRNQDAANAKLRQLGQEPLFNPADPPTDPWKRDLLLRLDRVRANCGELCAINSEQDLDKCNVGPHDPTAVTLPRQLQVPVNCKAIIMDEDVDVGDLSIPREPPDELMPCHTMNGAIPFQSNWMNQTYVGTDAAIPVWSVEFFEPIIAKIRSDFGTHRHIATHGKQPNECAMNLKQHVDFKGKRVLVVGTECPWLEALALWFRADHVVTLECGKITSTHPNVTTLLPSEFRAQCQAGTLELFDIVLSFSSLEHPGLGRYGDALNPWGDLISVARAHCVTKPGGCLGLSMPQGLSRRQRDWAIFNECRHYGPIRWPLITANWRQIDGVCQSNVQRHIRQKRHQPCVFQKALTDQEVSK